MLYLSILDFIHLFLFSSIQSAMFAVISAAGPFRASPRVTTPPKQRKPATHVEQTRTSATHAENLRTQRRIKPSKIVVLVNVPKQVRKISLITQNNYGNFEALDTRIRYIRIRCRLKR